MADRQDSIVIGHDNMEKRQDNIVCFDTITRQIERIA